jgi:hypothetical protein
LRNLWNNWANWPKPRKPEKSPSIRILLLLVFFAYPEYLYANANNYGDKLSDKIEKCRAIPEDEIQSIGIGIFSAKPSYYMRSKCFFELAIKERRPELCTHVKELANPYYTSNNCKKKTQEKIAKDWSYAEQLSGVHHKIEKAFFKRNNNGKDFDFVITVTGKKRICYKMELTIGSRVLYSDFQTFFNERRELHLYFPKAELVNRLDGLAIDETHRVKITLTKSIGSYAAKHLPENEKPIAIYTEVNFSKLKRIVERPN